MLMLDMTLAGKSVAVGETAAWLEIVDRNWQFEDEAGVCGSGVCGIEVMPWSG